MASGSIAQRETAGKTGPHGWRKNLPPPSRQHRPGPVGRAPRGAPLGVVVGPPTRWVTTWLDLSPVDHGAQADGRACHSYLCFLHCFRSSFEDVHLGRIYFHATAILETKKKRHVPWSFARFPLLRSPMRNMCHTATQSKGPTVPASFVCIIYMYPGSRRTAYSPHEVNGAPPFLLFGGHPRTVACAVPAAEAEGDAEWPLGPLLPPAASAYHCTDGHQLLCVAERAPHTSLWLVG